MAEEGAHGGDRAWARALGRGAIGVAAAAAAVISVFGSDSSALAESLTVAFPVSRAREVRTDDSFLFLFFIDITDFVEISTISLGDGILLCFILLFIL